MTHEPDPTRAAPPRRVVLLVVAVLLAAVVVIVALVLTRGGGDEGGAAGTPEETVERYVKALDERDCATLLEVAPDEAGAAECDAEPDQAQGLTLASIDVVEVDGDTATVQATVTVELGDEPTQDQPLVLVLGRTGGDWLIESVE